MAKQEWLRWLCPICGDILKSKHQKQLDWNQKLHEMKHQRKDEAKKH